MNVWRPVEHALCRRGARRMASLSIAQSPLSLETFHPAWAPAPLLKSTERTKPALGWPRSTDSLCPAVRQRDASAHPVGRTIDSAHSIDEQTGEIRAHILERDGKIVIEKTCPTHGTFTDTLAIDPAFLKRIEGLFPGRDFKAVASPACTITAHRRSSMAAAPCSRSI